MLNSPNDTGRGSFTFTFRLKPDSDPAPLVDALRQCVNPNPDFHEEEEERRITIQGQFDFPTAELLSKLAYEANPWYAPAAGSIVPPLLPETVQEALDAMLEFQEQDDSHFEWTAIPMEEMPQPTLHALHRMIAAEWVQPDYDRPDIAMVTAPENSQDKTLQQLIEPWHLTPQDLFQKWA